MRIPFLLVVATIMAGFAANVGSLQLVTNSPAAGGTDSGRVPSGVTPGAQAAVRDDLKWLVGRWRCLTRQFRSAPDDHPISDGDLLEYFNVYLPYADDNLSVKLTGDPMDRQIAAEFLTSYTGNNVRGEFTQSLAPPNDFSPVYISTNAIRAGYPFYTEFIYHRQTSDVSPTLLILDTKQMHFVFRQMPLFSEADMARQITNLSSSFVPVRSMSDSERLELKRKYDDLCKQTAQ